MRWEHVDNDEWWMPGGAGRKGNAKIVSLSALALQLIRPRKAKGYVFGGKDGAKAFSGYSKAKLALDQVIAEVRAHEGREPMPRWTLHDLRRSARSLMSRAGVPPDVAREGLRPCHPGHSRHL